MRRTAGLASLAAAALVLAACGSSTPAEPAAEVASTAGATTQPGAPTTTSPAVTAAPGDAPAPTAAQAPTAAPTPTPTPTEPAPPAMVWPDDGCSADNSPTPAAAAPGPAPALEIRAESPDGPLPDLVVRRINCGGGWVNLRNELPADRPLLVWFWVPH